MRVEQLIEILKTKDPKAIVCTGNLNEELTGYDYHQIEFVTSIGVKTYNDPHGEDQTGPVVFIAR